MPLESGRAALLGLGIIGSRVAARLAASGWQVAFWNRTPKGLPGEAPTPEAAVADAEVISIYLKDAPALRAVMARLAPALREGQIVLNHATVDLATTHWLDGLCAERGCRFLDAPFTGSKLAAASGQLVYYTGGDDGLVRLITPYPAGFRQGVATLRWGGFCHGGEAGHQFDFSMYRAGAGRGPGHCDASRSGGGAVHSGGGGKFLWFAIG